MPINPYEPPKEVGKVPVLRGPRIVLVIAAIPIGAFAGFVAFIAGIATWHFSFPYRENNDRQIACGLICAGLAATLVTWLLFRAAAARMH